MKLVAHSLLLIVAAGAAPRMALAHHTTANFDTMHKIELEGVITRYQWSNPHVFIWLEARDEQGNAVTWRVEAGPPALLRRAGITQDLISVGQHVKVSGSPARAKGRRDVLLSALQNDAKEQLAFGQAEATRRIFARTDEVPVAAGSLQGIWAAPIDMVAINKLAVRQLKLTDKGQRAAAAFVENTENYGKCLETKPPSSMLAPDIKQIELGKTTIRIGLDWDGVIRTVHMDQKSHEGVRPSSQGHSIGHWEGDTLVVDTSRFTPDSAGISRLVPSSSEKHLVERFKLDASGTNLLYSFILDDPEYLVEPVVSGEVGWTHRPDLKFAPVVCDPVLARMTVD
jgi:hypothetical protein